MLDTKGELLISNEAVLGDPIFTLDQPMPSRWQRLLSWLARPWRRLWRQLWR